MKIECIFEIIDEALASIKYEDEPFDAFTYCFSLWGDVEYLENFFEENKVDLQGEFWQMSVEDAVVKVLDEAHIFKEDILYYAEQGKNDGAEQLALKMLRIMGTWNLKTKRNMAINKLEQLRQTVGGFKKSDTLSRFKQEIEHGDSRKKSQLVALKILRTLRKLGLSQKQFAEQLNVTPQQVSKWVKGSENFTFETIEKIEKALGITLIDVAEEKAGMVSTKPIVASGSYVQVLHGRLRLSHLSGKVKRTTLYSRDKQYA